MPNASYFERSSANDPWSYVHINSDGFRDNRNNTGGSAVLVLGDSFTRGSLVNETEAYSYLLETWNPDLSFHNFGVPGFGQANSVRLYEEKGSNTRHTLTIQQIYLGNDIDDNAKRARLSGDGVRFEMGVGQKKNTSAVKELVLKVHLALLDGSRFYAWALNLSVGRFFNYAHARKDVDGAIEITRRLLSMLASMTRKNDADLLLLILPAWNEIVGRDDGMEPERQRAMLRHFAETSPRVHLLDMTPILVNEDPDRIYGVKDKHFAPYGHYLVAVAIDRWIAQQKGRTAPREYSFIPAPAVDEPDCSKAQAYAKSINPLL
ncbi:hypothetical protein N182_26480 [Sinorhizobium sp. GL2]|nr:hypothetical protein N182_26480 [Sinorhizobium sp. GL2]